VPHQTIERPQLARCDSAPRARTRTRWSSLTQACVPAPDVPAPVRPQQRCARRASV